MIIPILCDNCDTIYSSGICIDNAYNITFNNVKGKCYKCNTFNSIPDGIYNFTNNIIEVIQASEYSIERIVKLRNKIISLSASKADNEKVKKEIKKVFPELSELFKNINIDNKMLWEVIKFLQPFLILFLQQCYQDNQHSISNNTIVNEYHLHKTVNNYNLNSQKCLCGSGKHFLNCHGNISPLKTDSSFSESPKPITDIK